MGAGKGKERRKEAKAGGTTNREEAGEAYAAKTNL